MAEKNSGEMLHDIIEGLRSGKKAKQTLEAATDDSEDEFHDSFQRLDTPPEGNVSNQANNDSEINELQAELQKIKLEKQKAQLRQQIEKEKQDLRSLHTTVVQSSGEPTSHSTAKTISSGEQDYNYSRQEHKALDILSYIWTEPIEQYQAFSLGGDIEFRVGKKKTLDKVTIEEWGYANTRIMQELLKQNRLKNVDSYLNYTADVYRLASRNLWHSVLLYDKEYRERQAEERFEWGIYRQDLREFQLIPKRETPTTRAIYESSVQPRGRGRSQRGQDDRRKGPFLPDGREICRAFNYNACYRPDCKMMHNCAICYSGNHTAMSGHNQQQGSPFRTKNLELPQN